MPLLKRQKFKPIAIPDGLKDTDEVFFCPQTKEIFTDYEQFYERVILLNSLVWSCSITGRHGLTFDEASDSEQAAKASLDSFPEVLQKPVLFLACQTYRVRIDDCVNDIWNFMKCRFFKGELVDVTQTGAKQVGKVTEVWYCPPKNAEKSIVEVLSDSDNDSDVEMIQSEEVGTSKNRKNSQSHDGQPSVKSENGVAAQDDLNDPPDWYKYQIETIGTSRKKLSVTQESLSRRKGLLVKPKLKLFIKNAFEFVDGVWKIKPKKELEMNFDAMPVKEFFAGRIPKFERSVVVPRKSLPKKEDSPKETPSRKKSSKSTKVDHFEEAMKLAVGSGDNKYKNGAIPNGNAKITGKDGQKGDRLTQEQREEQKAAAKEAHRKELERQKEEQKEWKKPRDDLLCDDLAVIPKFPQVTLPSEIPASCYGDIFCVLEFFKSFNSYLKVEEEYPNGLSLVDLCRILLSTVVEGPFFGFLKRLCDIVFELQDAEDGDEADITDKQETQEAYELEHRIYGVHIIQATKFHEEHRHIHGLSVRNLPIDVYTITEVVRLHIMSAGYFTGLNTAKFRYQQRGGFRCFDDPGMNFRSRETQILEKLEKSTLFDLNPGERLKVIRLLIDQILTFSPYRDAIEESIERLRVAKAELRRLQFTESRNEREAHAAKSKIEKRNVQQSKKENSPSTSGTPQPTEEEEREKSKERSRILKLMSTEKDRLRRIYTQRDIKKDEDKSLLTDVPFEILTGDEIGEVRRLQRERFMVEETHLMEEIFDLHQSTGEILLGADRSHRKYWLFNSIPGVLLEAEISAEFLGPCEVGGTPITQQQLKLLENDSFQNGVLDSDEKPKNSVEKRFLISRNLLACTGNEKDCPVHSVDGKSPTWWWIDSQEKVPQLIDALNPRGFRESLLKTNISHFRQRINDCIHKSLLAKVIPVPPVTEEFRDTFELTLRDVLLEVEEKIFLGGLGSPHVTDRDQWRDEIINRRYLAFAAEISIGSQHLFTEEEINSQSCVTQMAAALLQIAQGIEPKYLKFPFGDGPDSNESKSSQVDDDGEFQTFERWQHSLIGAKGISQVYLHMGTLEQHVAWNKSLLNVKCRQCRKKGDVGNIVLCSGCDRGFHFICVKPQLKKPPDLPWLCSDCRPKTKDKNKKFRLKANKKSKCEEDDLYTDEGEETGAATEWEDTCASCGEGIQQKKLLAACSSCTASYHYGCCGLTSKPRSGWICAECNYAESESSGGETADSSSEGGERSKVVKQTRSFPDNASGKKNKRLENGHYEDPNDSSRSTYDDSVKVKAKRSSQTTSDGRASRDVIATKLAQCNELLDLLLNHESVWPFVKPVSRKQVPDYYETIEEPRDLSLIRKKLTKGSYRSAGEVIDDLHLMFNNCRTYNSSDAPVYSCGEQLEDYMNQCVEDLKLLDPSEPNDTPQPRKRKRLQQLISDDD